MRKIKSLILLTIICLSLSACSKKENLSLTYDKTQNKYVEIYNPDSITDEELTAIDGIKANATGTLKRAFLLEEKHRQLTLKELDFLLTIVKNRFQKSGLTINELKHRLHKRIERDTQIINNFNQAISKINYDGSDRALYLCKENRLYAIITSSYEIVQNHLHTLVQGKMPPDFRKSLLDITTLETDKGGEIVAGSFKPTCLKGVIVTILVELMGEKASASNIAIPQYNGMDWVDYSLIFHTIPLAKVRSQHAIHPEFKSFTYYYMDSSSPSQGELGFPHSGYYMGSNYARNPKKRIFNPEDCSSWVFKTLGAKHIITTYTAMQFFRIKSKSGLYEKELSSRNEYKYLDSILEPLLTNNIQHDVRAGDIICIRRPEIGEKVERHRSYGTSGHMAIALFVTKTHILALACTRDAPIMEGIGIQKISLETEKDSDIMFLREKAPD